MKFSEEVLQKCNKEFVAAMSPIAQDLIRKYGIIYYNDLSDFGQGIVPICLMIESDNIDLGLYDKVSDVAAKYCYDAEVDVGMLLLPMKPIPSGSKVFCSNE